MTKGVGLRWDAPAKVNLRLDILAREASGYHAIETVFQALDLCDTVDLELREDGAVELELIGVPEGALGPPQDNLAVRAAEGVRRALREGGKAAPGVRITLNKLVPHGAGLGGGSSDAATVLLGMNQLLDEPLPGPALTRIGAELGSDVPFFVSGAARALGQGRGDQIIPLDPLPVRDALLVVPPEPTSTAWAYSVLAARRAREAATVSPRRDPPSAASDWEEVAAQASNDFEEALFPLRPDLARLKEALGAAGARPALLSGSGSAVFGIFETTEAALAARAEVMRRMEDVRSILTRTLA